MAKLDKEQYEVMKRILEEYIEDEADWTEKIDIEDCLTVIEHNLL